MIILIIIILLATSYAITFKKDFPIELVYRTYIVFAIFLVLKNIKVVIKYITEVIYSMF